MHHLGGRYQSLYELTSPLKILFTLIIPLRALNVWYRKSRATPPAKTAIYKEFTP